MTKPKTLREQILDLFDRDPVAKVRSGPLAKALKADQTAVAAMLAKMAEPGGELIRCKVFVPSEQRTGGSPKEQWEYRLAAGVAPAPVKPYVPPKAARREIQNSCATPAGRGANNAGTLASETTSDVAPCAEGQGVAPAAEQSAPAADEKAAPQSFEQRAVEIACDRHNQLADLQADLASHLQTIERLQAEKTDLLHLVERQKAEIADLTLAAKCFQEANERMQAKLDNAKAFIVRVPKRKLRLMTNLGKANEASAKAANAAGQSELCAVISLGKHVRRKVAAVEWKAAE